MPTRSRGDPAPSVSGPPSAVRWSRDRPPRADAAGRAGSDASPPGGSTSPPSAERADGRPEIDVEDLAIEDQGRHRLHSGGLGGSELPLVLAEVDGRDLVPARIDDRGQMLLGSDADRAVMRSLRHRSPSIRTSILTMPASRVNPIRRRPRYTHTQEAHEPSATPCGGALAARGACGISRPGTRP
jgi:hypothetical protein